MPLSAVDFVVKGPIRSADIRQFVDLFTGVMLDQPITFRNSVVIGGNQGQTQAALSLYGAVGQTSNLLNLYPTTASLNPTFGFAASGAFGWGPGGSLVQDTFLSRIGTQNGHVTDTAGLLLQPNIEVTGSIFCDGPIDFPAGGIISDGGTASVGIGTDLAVQRNLYIGYDRSQWLYEVRPQEIGLRNKLLINTADAEASALTYANAMLQVRGIDMVDNAGTMIIASSAYIFAGNWLQFNPKFYKATAGNGYPGVALLLDYDVDANNSVGGRISMQNGKIGIGPNLPDPAGARLQIFGDTLMNGGSLNITGNLTIGGIANLQSNVAIAGTLVVGGVTTLGVVNASGAISTNSNVIVAGQVIASGRITAHADMVIGPTTTSGTLYMGADGTATMQRVTITNVGDVIALMGHSTYIDTQLAIGGAGNPQITFVTPTDPQGGGQVYRIIQPSTRPASQVGGGEVHIGIRIFADGDITSGTNMHAVSFMTTSNPGLKSNPVLMPDVDCMTRIRGDVPVYIYQMTPPVSGGFPAPTPNDIGFMAPDVYTNSPEFCALDSTSKPVAVVYGQMAAMLWGALRNLDQRCVAKGI
jgi:hypothetical protein